MPRISAGILLFRRDPRGALEVLLGHPGGPFHAWRDLDDWTIPKGLAEPGEALEAVARREFEEETGSLPPDGPLVDLGSVTQKGGKIVHAWGIAGDLDPISSHSNEFPLEWPPGSGRMIAVPELDRVAWFPLDEAHLRIKAAQRPFLDRVLEAVGPGTGPAEGARLTEP